MAIENQPRGGGVGREKQKIAILKTACHRIADDTVRNSDEVDARVRRARKAPGDLDLCSAQSRIPRAGSDDS